MEGQAAQTGGCSGWEKPLAGDGFEGLRRAISHRGERGAAYQQTRLWGLEIAGREVGRLDDVEEKEDRKNHRRIGPVPHWCRCGSAPMLNWFGVGAKVAGSRGRFVARFVGIALLRESGVCRDGVTGTLASDKSSDAPLVRGQGH